MKKMRLMRHFRDKLKTFYREHYDWKLNPYAVVFLLTVVKVFCFLQCETMPVIPFIILYGGAILVIFGILAVLFFRESWRTTFISLFLFVLSIIADIYMLGFLAFYGYFENL